VHFITMRRADLYLRHMKRQSNARTEVENSNSHPLYKGTTKPKPRAKTRPHIPLYGEATMNLIKIDEITIDQDENARYSLTALHRASGGEQKHRPKYWLALDKTKELLALQPEDALHVQRGGGEQGTYVTKKLIYAYAAWVSAQFYDHVLEVFEKAQTPTIRDPQLAVLATMLQSLDEVRYTQKKLEEEQKEDREFLRGHKDYYRVRDFCRDVGMGGLTDVQYMQIGRLATKLAKGDVKKVYDARWGTVNEYKENVISEAVSEYFK
jgi:hypothetical protein